MSLRELLRTAFHSLRINPVRSTLAVIGVIFGIMAVVALISMGQGVRAQITDQIRELGSDLLIVKSGIEEAQEEKALSPQQGIGPQVNSSTLTTADTEKIAGLEEWVAAATGTIEQMNKVESGEKAMNIKVIGNEKGFTGVRKLEMAREMEGWSIEDQERGACAIGMAVDESFYGDESALGKEVRIGDMVFTVKAVVDQREKTLMIDPNREIYICIDDAREMFGVQDTDRVLEIYVKASDAGKVEDAREEIIAALDETHRERTAEGEEYSRDFHVATQGDLMSSYNRILGILNALVIGVALIALAESGIGVSNIMYVAVRERTREIGVRLAQGASSRAIMTQFLFESVTICLLGALIGVPAGLLLSYLINEYTVLPTQTPLWGVLLAFGAATVVGVAAGLYPAWKATKADIAVILRAE